MPNQDAILANIRKLRDMGLNDEELLTELEGMNIPRAQAERWVRQATSKEITPSELPGLETPTPRRTTTQTQTSPVSTPPKPAPQPAYQTPQPDTSIAKLWEKGILQTVDSKLAQMEKLKKEIDDVLETKVNEHYQVMEKKLEALFEAQRELFRFKMDAQMDAKVKDMDEILNQKIDEIRRLNTATQEDLQRIKGQKMIMQEIMGDITAKSAQLDQTRRMIMDDASQKLERLEEKVDELVNRTDDRVSEVEQRATKTLEIEQKITQGLSDQMETQANAILEDKVKDLRGEIRDEIVQLKKLGADLASKDIQSTMQEFIAMNAEMKKTKMDLEGMLAKKSIEMDEALNKKMLDVDKIVNTKMETIVTMKEKDFFRKIEEQAADMASTQRELGQKLVEAETKLQNVDAYTKQLLETIKKANLEREDQVKNYKQKLDEFEGKADQKMSILETRTKQLDQVVSQLSELIAQWKTQMDQIKQANTTPTGTPASNVNKDTKSGFGLFGK
jgi:chromosome segregation ATPase